MDVLEEGVTVVVEVVLAEVLFPYALGLSSVWRDGVPSGTNFGGAIIPLKLL